MVPRYARCSYYGRSRAAGTLRAGAQAVRSGGPSMDAVGSDSPAAVGPAADLPDPAEHDWCAYPGIPGPGTRAGRLVRGLAGSCAVGGRGGRRRSPPSSPGSPPRGTPWSGATRFGAKVAAEGQWCPTLGPLAQTTGSRRRETGGDAIGGRAMVATG